MSGGLPLSSFPADQYQRRRRRRWRTIASGVMRKLDRDSARDRENVVRWWIDFRVIHGKPVDVGTRRDLRDFFSWRDEQPVRMWSAGTDTQYAVTVKSWLRWWGGWRG